MKPEAESLVLTEIASFGNRPWDELVSLIGMPVIKTVVGSGGSKYQVELEAMWDAKPNGNIRVFGSIDDGGLRALVPLTRDALISRK